MRCSPRSPSCRPTASPPRRSSPRRWRHPRLPPGTRTAIGTGRLGRQQIRVASRGDGRSRRLWRSASWRRVWSGGHRRPGFPPVVLRYAMTLPDSAALVDHNGSGLAYAPDGSVFAYTSRCGPDAARGRPARRRAGCRRTSRRQPVLFPRRPVARVYGWRQGPEGAARRRRAGDDLRLLHRLLLLLGQRRHRPLPHGARHQFQLTGVDGGVGPGRKAVRDRSSGHGLDRCVPGAHARAGDPHGAVLGLRRIGQPPRGVESRDRCHHQIRSAGIQPAVGCRRIRDPWQLGRQPDRPPLRCETGSAERTSRHHHA